MYDKERSIGDVHTNAFLSAVQDKLEPVRAMCKNKETGEMFEVVGIKRDNEDVVPLFLVPIGGAGTIIDKYEILSDNPLEVNRFDINDYLDSPSSNLH